MGMTSHFSFPPFRLLRWVPMLILEVICCPDPGFLTSFQEGMSNQLPGTLSLGYALTGAALPQCHEIGRNLWPT